MTLTPQSPAGVLAIAVGFALSAGCAATTADPSATNRNAALLQDFRERVAKYIELREDATEHVPDADVTNDPSKLRAREQALAAAIRARRAGAKHGDIFTQPIRAHFRELLAPELKGKQGRDIKAILQEDAPAPGAVPIDVNAKYPAGLPVPTAPPQLLLSLPVLPAGLEYRFIGRDLVLLDQPADVILDYIRNAIPSPVLKRPDGPVSHVIAAPDRRNIATGCLQMVGHGPLEAFAAQPPIDGRWIPSFFIFA